MASEDQVVFIDLVIAGCIALSIIPTILEGGRIVILVPFVLVVMRGRALRWPNKKMILNVGAVLAITVVLGGAMSSVIGSLRLQSDLSLQDVLSESLDTIGSGTSQIGLTQTVLKGMITKFDSISWGQLSLKPMDWSLPASDHMRGYWWL